MRRSILTLIIIVICCEGEILAQQLFGISFPDAPSGLFNDDAGDFYSLSNENNNFVFRKLASDLSVLEADTFGGASQDRGYELTALSNGDYLITGNSQSFAAPPFTDVTVDRATALYRVKSNGDIVWTRFLSGSSFGENFSTRAIELDDGRIAISGHSQNPDSCAGYAARTALLSSSGDIIWSVCTQPISGLSNPTGFDIFGNFDGTLSSVVSYGNLETYHYLYDLSGNLISSKMIYSGAAFREVVSSGDGGFICGGWNDAGIDQAIIASFSADGSLNWESSPFDGRVYALSCSGSFLYAAGRSLSGVAEQAAYSIYAFDGTLINSGTVGGVGTVEAATSVAVAGSSLVLAGNSNELGSSQFAIWEADNNLNSVNWIFAADDTCSSGDCVSVAGIANWAYADIFIPDGMQLDSVYGGFDRATVNQFNAYYCAGCEEMDHSLASIDFLDGIGPANMYDRWISFTDGALDGPAVLRIAVDAGSTPTEWDSLGFAWSPQVCPRPIWTSSFADLEGLALNWKPVPGALGYKLEGKPVSAGGYRTLALTSASFDAGLGAGCYDWRVSTACLIDGSLEFSAPTPVDTVCVPTLREITQAPVAVSVYPNPASDYIIADASLHEQVRLLDLMGTVLQVREGRQQVQFDIGELPSGMYLLQFEGVEPVSSTIIVE